MEDPCAEDSDLAHYRIVRARAPADVLKTRNEGKVVSRRYCPFGSRIDGNDRRRVAAGEHVTADRSARLRAYVTSQIGKSHLRTAVIRGIAVLPQRSARRSVKAERKNREARINGRGMTAEGSPSAANRDDDGGGGFASYAPRRRLDQRRIREEFLGAPRCRSSDARMRGSCILRCRAR